MKTKAELTAPCGLDCFNCLVYEENITEEIKKLFVSQYKMEYDKISCKGCREQPGCTLIPFQCATLECINSKAIKYCCDCNEFPCQMLIPASKGADIYPHNYKLYNLCRIKKVGVETWAECEADIIRQKYFKGKFIPGKGPVME